MIPARAVAVMAVVSLSLDAAAAGEISGFAAAELRVFTEDAALPRQRDRTFSPSLLLRPEYREEWSDGQERLTAIPFYRWDHDDSHRTHFDVRELNWYHKGGDWDLRFGVGRVFWGVTESRHLVDIVNQVDFVEDIDEEDRLGQPMLNLDLTRDWGNVSLFVLPYFRERTFPGARGRLRFQFPVDTDRASYESNAEEWHVDYAGRYSRTFGDWDIGIAHFWGTGREPRLVPDESLQRGDFNNGSLIPRYDIINQTSVDIQGAKGNWLIKFEGMTRGGNQGDRFAALVTGVEYTLYGVAGTAADVGLLAEYLYDGRDQPPPPAPSAPPTPFDDDFYVGARFAFNDPEDTDLLAGVIIDRHDQELLFSIEGGRRLGDRWKLEVEGRWFVGIDPDKLALAGFANDDYLQLRLIRYF